MDPMCTRTSDTWENNDRELVGKASARTMGRPQRKWLKVHPFTQYSLQKHSDSTCKRQNWNYSNIKTSVSSKIYHKWSRGSTEWEALLKTRHLSETTIRDVKGHVPVSNERMNHRERGEWFQQHCFYFLLKCPKRSCVWKPPPQLEALFWRL